MQGIYEAPTTLERLSRAFSSDDLTLRESRCDLDLIIALGWSAFAAGRHAPAFLRLAFDNDHGAFREARGAALAQAKRMNQRKGWRVTKVSELVTIADCALALYINPTCPHCQGRKLTLIPGTPHLSGRQCPHCHGSGRRPIPAWRRREISDLLSRIEDLQHAAIDATRKRLSHKGLRD
jgi:hypothetical protein